MQKPIAATIVVISLIITSLAVAGCTTPSLTPSVSTAPTTHNASLEKFLTTYENREYANKSQQVKAWEVEWLNSTSVRLLESVLIRNVTSSYDSTYLMFSTSQDATNYINAMNKTAYSLETTDYRDSPNAIAYQNATGHAPQVFKRYIWNEGNPFNISEFKSHQLLQIDNMVVVITGKILG